MTIADIHKAFKVYMDKNSEAVAFGGCPAFLPVEIDLFLNLAYIEVICNKFTGNNVLKAPFEGGVKRVADLENLVRTDYDLSASLNSNSNVLTIENFSGGGTRMFYVNAVLNFGDQKSNCMLVSHDDAFRFLKSYNNDPWIDTPVAVLEDDTLQIYIDTYTMNEPYTVDITYVKFPTKIDSNYPTLDITEVPNRVMYEVITRAVLIALETIEALRTTTKSQLSNIQE